MLRVYHLIIGGVLLGLMPLGIKGFKTVFHGDSPTNKEVSVSVNVRNNPSQNAINKTNGNIWGEILGDTSSPKDWRVAACEGKAPLLCVSSLGEVVGRVEIGIYSIKGNSKFQKHLSNAGIPLGSQLDYQNPKYKQQLLTVLNSWVADLETTIAKQRQLTYGDKMTFSAYPPQPALVGQLQGVSYGFVGLTPEGRVQEKHISYVAFDGDKIYIINTGFGKDAMMGNFDNLENLAIFQGYLPAMVTDLKLPVK